MSRIEAIPVKFPLLRETTVEEVAEIIRPFAEEGDLVVVCSSLMARCEGRLRRLDEYEPSEEAMRIAEGLGEDPRFVQAVLEESREVLIEKPFLLVKAKFGNVCVNAGIDRSNVEDGYILLPPENPDMSAKKLGKLLGSPVIVTDSNGRCFRRGVTGFAIGCYGIKPLKDWCGQEDIFGRKLEKTQECVVDEIAAFANLLMGEGNSSIPAVVFRGLDGFVEIVMDDAGDETGVTGVREVYRNEEEDIIRRIILEWSKKS